MRMSKQVYVYRDADFLIMFYMYSNILSKAIQSKTDWTLRVHHERNEASNSNGCHLLRSYIKLYLIDNNG